MTRNNTNTAITAAVCATAAQDANTRKREAKVIKTKNRMARYRKACLRAAQRGKYQKKFFAGYTILHWLFRAPSSSDFRCYLDPDDNFFDGFEVISNRFTVTVKWLPKR